MIEPKEVRDNINDHIFAKEETDENVPNEPQRHLSSNNNFEIDFDTEEKRDFPQEFRQQSNWTEKIYERIKENGENQNQNKPKTRVQAFEKTHGVKLGFMSAFVQASTAALQELPAVNGVIDDETNEIVYRDYVDISVAVASPNGLVVPVLRNCETMNFADVEKSIAMYGGKAKEGKLSLEEMTGGTFTISNGGVFGSLMGTPIINPPQSAILGMHATKMRAVVVDGKVEARPMMYLALTYDHRLIDGREAVTFLKSVANKIEDPNRLLLSM